MKYGGTYFLPWSIGEIHYPTIEYVNQEGIKGTYKINKGYDIARYEIGQKVSIVIDTNEKPRKRKIYINRWVYLWYANIAWLVLSVLLISGSIYELYINQ